jgi:bacteriorhodopsin
VSAFFAEALVGAAAGADDWQAIRVTKNSGKNGVRMILIREFVTFVSIGTLLNNRSQRYLHWQISITADHNTLVRCC